ncbi:peroxidase 20 [Phoenix dactylifera]|uniref:Peroxidase n=1 Tax=Phoenix dactylifera TaxID=42345 RepID=A0A8B8ZG79_PHODC|nr:peroxidase 20 [Phoenix dactylifera]
MKVSASIKVLMAKLLALFLLLISNLVGAPGELSPYYYEESCPLAEEIVRQVVTEAVYRNPRIAASLLRLHFHDCFVLGCDASLLLDDAGDIVSEKNAVPNLNSVRGFDVIDRIKAVLEEACPLTVSCADILAITARDCVHLRGGPRWEVLLGRKDSLKASLTAANQMIPAPNFTLEMLISNFQAQGLDIVDLVTLSGSHTIGRSRCTSFKQRLYTPQPYLELDYHRRYSVFFSALRSMCPASGRDNVLVPLDLKTSRRFDNQYFFNLLRGNGLLQSDNELVSEYPEAEVLSLVWAYASNQELFFKHFANSMIKMGNINVLTGDEGEVRHNCRHVNAYYH